MKQMKYLSFRRDEVIVLVDDVYKGYRYIILDLGTHPTAYVVVNNEHVFYQKEYQEIDDLIDVHYGLTYSRDHLCGVDLPTDVWVLGWDYAHYGDRYGDEGGTTWFTSQVQKECFDVIEQFDKINRL